jgi:hypothetical protein
MFSFSYSVTRQYPYKWFTPTAIIGGIVLTIVFSYINFFSNAYNMVTTTTNDPSWVEAQRSPGRVSSMLTSKIRPKCEDAIIQVGSTMNTNQTALAYQLLSVVDYPALTYHNQIIENCALKQISIEFQTNNGRPASLIDISGWGVSVSAESRCTVQPPYQVIDLSALYDPLSADGVTGVSSFIKLQTAEFLWAQTLLLGFWAETLTAITYETAQQSDVSDTTYLQYNLSSGYITFERPLHDINDTSFFQSGQYAFFDRTSKRYRGNFSSQTTTSLEQLIADGSWPNIWAPANRLAKAMYSATMADLGQNYIYYNLDDLTSERQEIPVTMSMIKSPERLHYWTENLTQIWDACTLRNKDKLLLSQTLNLQMAQYNATESMPLQSTNSAFSATYTCQVPRLKSRFNIFISILVADLVLLRVAWSLYNFVVCYFLKDRHKDSNLCLGCLERGRDDDAGTEEHVSTDADEDTDLHGEVIELTNLASDREDQADEQSSQNLLTRKPVGG